MEPKLSEDSLWFLGEFTRLSNIKKLRTVWPVVSTCYPNKALCGLSSCHSTVSSCTGLMLSSHGDFLTVFHSSHASSHTFCSLCLKYLKCSSSPFFFNLVYFSPFNFHFIREYPCITHPSSTFPVP